MSISSELIIAASSEASDVLASELPSRTWEGFGYKGLDNIKLVTLWSLVDTDSPLEKFDERLKSLSVVSNGDGGPWVDIIPASMLASLASIASREVEECDSLAEAWGETQEFKGWSAEEVSELLREVGDLAESAQLQDKTLMLWRSH